MVTELMFPLSKLAEHTINKKIRCRKGPHGASTFIRFEDWMKYDFPGKFTVNFSFQPFLEYPG